MNKNIIYIFLIFIVFCINNINADWTTNPSERSYYFIEHDENGNPLADGSIWLKGSFDDTTFYVYYNGDSYNSDYADGNFVCELYDNFNGASLNNSKWLCGEILGCESLTISNSTMILKGTTTGTKATDVGSIKEFPINTSITSYTKASNSHNFIFNGFRAISGDLYPKRGIVYGFSKTTTQYALFTFPDVSGTANIVNLASTSTNWAKYTTIRNGTTDVKSYRDKTLVATSTTKIPTTNLSVWWYSSDQTTAQTEVEWVCISKLNTYTTSYGSEESGSWTIDGITYTKRKQVNMTGTFDGEIELDYDEFSSENITITTFNGYFFNIVSPVPDSETFTYETEIDILLNITNYTEIDVITYTLNGGSAEVYTTPINLTDLEFGEHTLFVWANNTEGETTRTINFTISPYPIDFDINSPMERVYTTQTSSRNILINITNSTYVSSIVYSFNGGTTNITYTNETFTSRNLGNHTIDVWGITPNNIEHKQVNFSVIYSEVLNLCDNYFSDSGSYDKFIYKGRTFYVYNGEESECQNDILLQFYYRNTGDIFVRFYGETDTGTWLQSSGASPTLTIGEWYDENIFEEGYVLEKFASTNYNPRIYDKSGNYIEMSGDATFGIDNGNYTICVGVNCLNMEKPYFKITYPFRSGYGDYTWRTTDSNWFWNASNVARVNTLPSIYFYTDNDENLGRSSAYYQNMRTGDKYSLNVYKHLTNWNGDSEISYGGTGDYYAIWEYPYNSTEGKIRIVSSEESSEYYSAYLLYGGSLIIPKWSVYFMTYGNMYPFITHKRYDAESYATTLYSNVATMIEDNNGVCYFVPPFSPSNLTSIYTLQAYLIQCDYLEGESVEEVISYPLLPNYINCGNNGTDYNVNIKYKENVIFETYITRNNVVEYYSLNDNELITSYEITNQTSLIDVKVNGKTRCYWDNSDTIVGLDLGLGDNDLVKQLIGYPLILVAIGLSMVNPFVFVFVFVINDIFSLILVEHIFFLAISVGLMSLVANWNGERNFKTLIILCLLATAYLVQVSSFESDIAGAELTELSTITESIQTLFGGIGSSADLVVIITSVLPTFLLNLIVLILKLPAILISIIFASIGAITPLAITPLRYFEGALIVGAYVFIILKGYEMGRNMFRSV